MVSISRRRAGFLVGLFFLAIGTICFLAGFLSPYWHYSRREDRGILVVGLWVLCDLDSNVLTDCRDTIIGTAGMIHAVQFFQSVAVLLLIPAGALAIVIHVSRRPRFRRLLDVTVSFGAVFALFGSLGYLLHTLFDDAHLITFQWGFGINATGAALCDLAAILIACCRAPPGGEEEEVDMGKHAYDHSSTQKDDTPPEVTSYYVTEPRPLPVVTRPQLKEIEVDRESWLLPPALHWASNVRE